MNHIKKLIEKLSNEELEQEIIGETIVECRYCNSTVSIQDAYIDKEDLNIYCSKKCFIENLSSKYF